MGISFVRRGRLAFAGMAVLPALALAGCGGIDPGSIESIIKKHLSQEGATPQSVKCPGSIEDKASQVIDCNATVTISGKSESGVVKVTLQHNKVTDLQFVPSGGGAATPATPSTPSTTTT